ncbi:hypothetical protein HUJ04_002654 [Dendroctonus ponderosae]
MSMVAPKLLTSARLSTRLITKLPQRAYVCYALTTPSAQRAPLVASCARFSRNPLECTVLRHSSSKAHPSTDNNNEEQGKKLSLFQRFKQMYRDYWYVLLPVHVVTSTAWFGGFYYLAISGVDIPALLESMNMNEKIINTMRNSSMGYLAITYGLYKITTPVRYAVTLGGTTLSINYLRRWGYIKPIPSKERLKEIYAETKEGMKEKKENLMETVHHLQQTVKETKDGIKETKDHIVSSVKESKDSIKSMKQKVISSTHKNQNKP